MNKMTINELAQVLITRLILSGKEGTAFAYASSARKVVQTLGNNIALSTLFSPEGICLYERLLYSEGLGGNTVSFYLRILRAIYNKGIALNMCPHHPHLFDGVYTGVAPTPKRAVSPGILGKLQVLDLSGKKNLAFARDMFLLSFCLQGISFVDLAHLRKVDLRGSLLTYRRAKTGKQVTVALPALAHEIIGKYTPQTETLPYLLPIIRFSDKSIYLQYKSALRTYNRRLKKLAILAGVEENLTSYVVRHTWATAAQRETVPTALISQALGHRTERITQIYLAGFDHSELLQANEKVLAAANLVSASCTDGRKEVEAREKNVSHSIGGRHFRLQT